MIKLSQTLELFENYLGTVAARQPIVAFNSSFDFFLSKITIQGFALKT